MSIVAPPSRLGWRLLPAVVLGAAMVIAASIMIDALRTHPVVISAADEPTGAAAAVEGVAWDMKVFPVGTNDGLTKVQRRHFEAQRPRVTKVVRKVFGAMAGEAGLDAAVAKHFTATAARAFRRTKAAVPAGAALVVIQRRNASIGIQGTPPRAAAARVTLKAKAEIGGRMVSWSDRATLWLERSKRGWVIIAFDLVRERS